MLLTKALIDRIQLNPLRYRTTRRRTSRDSARATSPLLACLLAILASSLPGAVVGQSLDFVQSSVQPNAIVDNPVAVDYQPTAKLNANGTMNIWYCGSDTLYPNGFPEKHDTIFHALGVVGQSNSTPNVAIHSGSEYGNRFERWDSKNVCSPGMVQTPSGHFQLYYECSPILFDIANPGGSFSNQSTLQVCLARYTASGWKVFDGNTFVSPAASGPSPVVKMRDETILECQLSDDSGPLPRPIGQHSIDGKLYGNPSVCGSIRHYGMGHPSAIKIGGEVWLYYYDSIADKVRLRKSSNSTGTAFGAPQDTDIPYQGSVIKYFPDLVVDGQTGVFIGTAAYSGERLFYYSLNGLQFQASTTGNPLFEIGLANGSDPSFCVTPGEGTFVSNAYGEVVGTGQFQFLSPEGQRGDGDGAGPGHPCYDPAEDGAGRGTTWDIYYFEGEFFDSNYHEVNLVSSDDPATWNNIEYIENGERFGYECQSSENPSCIASFDLYNNYDSSAYQAVHPTVMTEVEDLYTDGGMRTGSYQLEKQNVGKLGSSIFWIENGIRYSYVDWSHFLACNPSHTPQNWAWHDLTAGQYTKVQSDYSTTGGLRICN